MSLLIVGLDTTIVNVALPSIHRDLHAPLSDLQWTIDAYTLVLASLLVLAGSTADRLGRKRVFQTGLAVFSVGSGLCALAPNVDFLIAARAVQATGGAMLNPVALSIIRNVFQDPRELAQAIGVWGAMPGISMALGPIAGGALIAATDWRAVFLINLPVGAAAIVLTARYVPESRAPQTRRFDLVAQGLVIVAFSTLTYAIIEGPHAGWSSARIVAMFAAALISFATLIPYELRHREPLIDMRLFTSAPFAGAIAIAVLLLAGIGGFLFLNTIYLQDVRGLSPLHAGLYTLPMAVAMLIASPISGQLVSRIGTRVPLVLGGLAVLVGALMLTRLQPTTGQVFLFAAYVIFGVGSGVVNPPVADTAVSGMPPERAGVASAIASTGRQLGTALGVAVLGAIVGSASSNGEQVGRGFAAATHAAWWSIAALGALIAILGLLTTTPWARSTSHGTAALAQGAVSPVAD